jgi:hypothetical protein
MDGCITKAPCGDEKAGPSPADRRKGGLKQPVCVEGYGIPLGLVPAGANRHDSPLLEPTLQTASVQAGPLPEDVTAHLDAACDSGPTRLLPDDPGLEGEIARKGIPSPIQAGKRRVAERTNSWMNGYGKLRRMTDKDGQAAGFSLYLAAALVTVRQLIQRARTRYRSDTRPPPDASSDLNCRSF